MPKANVVSRLQVHEQVRVGVGWRRRVQRVILSIHPAHGGPRRPLCLRCSTAAAGAVRAVVAAGLASHAATAAAAILAAMPATAAPGGTLAASAMHGDAGTSIATAIEGLLPLVMLLHVATAATAVAAFAACALCLQGRHPQVRRLCRCPATVTAALLLSRCNLAAARRCSVVA